MAEYYLNTSDINEWAAMLCAGDRVYLSGTVYTSRDAAHKRIKSALDNNENLPFELKNAVIYYAGPTPAKEGMPVGSIGPTTSGRMDVFTPLLLNNGLKAMIGKGNRSDTVVSAMIRNKAVYFAAVGGAGALYSKCIKSCEGIAFEDLGCESVKKLEFCDFPLLVAIDSKGNNLYNKNNG